MAATCAKVRRRLQNSKWERSSLGRAVSVCASMVQFVRRKLLLSLLFSVTDVSVTLHFCGLAGALQKDQIHDEQDWNGLSH